MPVAFLIPDGQYEFFGQMVEPMRAAGIDVRVNRIVGNEDLILAGILPITHEWIDPINKSGKPFILWNWDLYPTTNYNEPRWRAFLELLPKAADVWSCSYEVARQTKERLGLDSFVVPAWVNSAELAQASYVSETVFYAASGGGLVKRVDWAKRACELLNYELMLTTNQKLSRQQYLKVIADCRVYLCTASDTTNGTIPAMEAAACGRPVVLPDLPAARETFGDTTYMFRSNDFGHLLHTLRQAWEIGHLDRCRERILRLFDLPVVAKRVVRRLQEVMA